MPKLQSNSLSPCPLWQKEVSIMNRVNNWLVLTLVFFGIALGTMTFTNQPAIAWAIMVPALISAAMAVIRYDDYRKAQDVGYGSVT